MVLVLMECGCWGCLPNPHVTHTHALTASTGTQADSVKTLCREGVIAAYTPAGVTWQGRAGMPSVWTGCRHFRTDTQALRSHAQPPNLESCSDA